MKAGMIGLGAMGFPMAARLAEANWLKAVWNRTPEKSESFGYQYSIPVAAECNDLAATCEVIFICVSADRDVIEIIEQLTPGLRPNTILIDCSTVSPETALSAAIRLKSRGCYFLDAPVSGGVEGAANGTLSMMVGGEKEILEKVTPMLNCLGQRITHMGGTGTGQGTKSVNQILAAGINQAVSEALSFGLQLGLDMDKVVDVVSAGAAGNWFLSHRGKTMLKGDYKTGFKIGLHHKDLNICLKTAQQAKINLPLTEKTRADYQQLMEAGFSDEDISALFRLKRQDAK